MGDLIYQPEPGHRCPVTAGGSWFETRELPTDSYSRLQGFTTYAAFIHEHDRPGTVRACGECGRTWVAHKNPSDNVLVSRWRREGRAARWWRELMQGRD